MKYKVENAYLRYSAISFPFFKMYQCARRFSSCDSACELDRFNGRTFYTNTSNSLSTSSSGMLSSFRSSGVNRVLIPLKYLEQKVLDSLITYASTINPIGRALFRTNCFSMRGLHSMNASELHNVLLRWRMQVRLLFSIYTVWLWYLLAISLNHLFVLFLHTSQEKTT